MQTLFRFNIQSYSDIITNSSSELFVFKEDSVEKVVNLLNTIYPNWREEYELPILFKNMTKDKQHSYIDWVAYPPMWFTNYNYNYNGVKWVKRTEKEQIETYRNDLFKWYLEKFDISKKEVPLLFENWNRIGKDNYLEFSSDGYDVFYKKFENDIALWSLYDNPSWDYQEILENYATRHHLG